MKSNQYIESLYFNHYPMPIKDYDSHKFLADKLLELGFFWQDDSAPHYKLRAGDVLVTISPFPNVVIVDLYKRSFVSEVYFEKNIPENEVEFTAFWEGLRKHL